MYKRQDGTLASDIAVAFTIDTVAVVSRFVGNIVVSGVVVESTVDIEVVVVSGAGDGIVAS